MTSYLQKFLCKTRPWDQRKRELLLQTFAKSCPALISKKRKNTYTMHSEITRDKFSKAWRHGDVLLEQSWTPEFFFNNRVINEYKFDQGEFSTKTLTTSAWPFHPNGDNPRLQLAAREDRCSWQRVPHKLLECLTNSGSQAETAPKDCRVSGSGNESGIFHNEPDVQQDHCVIL